MIISLGPVCYFFFNVREHDVNAANRKNPSNIRSISTIRSIYAQSRQVRSPTRRFTINTGSSTSDCGQPDNSGLPDRCMITVVSSCFLPTGPSPIFDGRAYVTIEQKSHQWFGGSLASSSETGAIVVSRLLHRTGAVCSGCSHSRRK